jgi:ATP-binding cassette subfamily B protein
MLRRGRRVLVIAGIAIHVALALLPLTAIVTTSVMLSEVPVITNHTGRHHALVVATVAVAIAIGALILQQALAPFQTLFLELIARDVDGVYLHRLSALCLTQVPFPRLERPETFNLLNEVRAPLLRSGPASAGDGTAAILALTTRYAQLAGAAALIAITLGIRSCLVVMLAALITRFGQRGSLARFGSLWARFDAARRNVYYLRSIGLGTNATKEIRIFGLLPWLRDRHRADTEFYLSPLWRERKRILGRPFLAYSFAATIGGGYVLVTLVDAVVHRDISLLSLSIGIQAILLPMRFGVFFPECDIQTLYGSQACRSLAQFERDNLRNNKVIRGASERHLPPRCPEREVRFENVSFCYENSNRRILDGVQLQLPAGKSTAIVGLNGAGKSTLVKLLAKLYEPNSGRVIVDNQDLRSIDVRDWRRHLAVVFQDYVKYDFSLADNIAIGAPQRYADLPSVIAAATKAGADDILTSLSHGLQTRLSSRYLGGRDLSGGQWQRIALARAFFAINAGASLLILDEPTAQLDIEAEARFYDNFLELTRGLTTLIISHRFASVRRADQVAILENGRITEQGNHDALLQLGGQYARLFHLQAQSFRTPVRIP